MTEMPTGTVTFLFTDLEGSTRLWEQLPDAMRGAMARHDEILREAVEKRGGAVVKTTGDGLHAAFATAQDAIAAAVDAQRALGDEPWELPDPLRVRMGVHTGEADLREGDYFGTAVNRAARVSATAHGGQVLVSHATEELVRDHLTADVSLADLGEQRLRDLARPERVFELRASGLRTGFPPLRTGSAVPTNLPLMATALIGRDEDVEELVASVTEHRLVTLAGPGGIGKTRLAMEVAAAVGGGFADGVWFVDLAPVVADDDVVAAVAATMGASGVAGTEAALLGYLAQRRLVLLLDNCEHVIDGAAALAEALLAGAPEVCTVATSRELLDVAGEAVHWVTPLGVPEGGTALDGSPAVELFVERARGVRPDFALSLDNAEDVAEICRRLDGVPLAIELAAARVVSMAPHDIRERLGERFRLLAGGRRRQDRHRTLQATVGWSYYLLEPEEQRVFRALSVFGGSFDLAAAAEVVGGDEFEVADIVAGLARRSLVGHHGATGRYRLLETLRQYGADRLVEAGESGPAQERFTEHMLQLAEAEGKRLEGAALLAAKARLWAELDNFRAAAEWLAERGRPEALVVLCRSLWRYLTLEAPSIGRAWIDPVVDRDELDDPQLRYDARWLAGALAIVEGDVDRALTMIESGRAIASGDDDVDESPWSLHPEMLMASTTYDRPGLRSLCARASALALARGDAAALNFAASMEMNAMTADTPEFDQRVVAQLAEAEASGNSLWMAQTLACASGALIGDDFVDAQLERVVELIESHPTWQDAGRLFDVVVPISYVLGLTSRSPGEAVRWGLVGVRAADEIGADMLQVNCLEGLLLATALTGQAEAAARLRNELLHGTRRPTHLRPALYADVDRLLAEQGIGPAEPGPPLSRRELLDLLDEIEGALEEGPP